MYKLKEIADKVYYVGVNDRQKVLFENMWPLPYGVSYNSYLIIDEKTVLVDTVDVCYSDIFLKKIEDALEITNKMIIDELGGLPPVKVHCSVLADKAIKNAIYDYAMKHGKKYAALEGYDPNADEDDEEHGAAEE